jgi:ADP-L-glycero-D-manno-heptose 6-epimerase
MKVLVTGGAGFIGSNIARFLCRQGVDVFVLDDFSCANFKNIADLECDVICADITEDRIYKRLPKVDAVIHQAAITDTTLRDDKKMMMVNYEGFCKILDFCQKNNIKLVYASSAGVYGNGPSPMREDQPLAPLNTYAYSKYLCDREVIRLAKKKNSTPVVGLRYFNVYGLYEEHKGKSSSMIYQLYLQMARDNSPRIFKYGEQKRDFIYVEDVVEVTVKALQLNQTVILNVGKGEARSFNEVIEIINRILSKNFKPVYFDNPYQGVYQDFTQADITLLKRIMNFTPKFSLEEGIEDYLKNYIAKSQIQV